MSPSQAQKQFTPANINSIVLFNSLIWKTKNQHKIWKFYQWKSWWWKKDNLFRFLTSEGTDLIILLLLEYFPQHFQKMNSNPEPIFLRKYTLFHGLSLFVPCRSLQLIQISFLPALWHPDLVVHAKITSKTWVLSCDHRNTSRKLLFRKWHIWWIYCTWVYARLHTRNVA